MTHEKLQSEFDINYGLVTRVDNPHIDEDFQADQVPVFNYLKDAEQSLIFDSMKADREVML
jgi:hypothetical protein